MLVAHNGKSFDFRFLAAQMRKADVAMPPHWLGLDSLHLVRSCVPNLPSYKLREAALSLPAPHAHPLSRHQLGPRHRKADDVRCWPVAEDLREHFGLPPPELTHRGLPDAMVLSVSGCGGNAVPTRPCARCPPAAPWGVAATRSQQQGLGTGRRAAAAAVMHVWRFLSSHSAARWWLPHRRASSLPP